LKLTQFIFSMAILYPVTMNAESNLNPAQTEVAKLLDGFHLAASKADGKAYFDSFAPEGVFIGTDATERWTVEQFKAYAQPFFSKGKGWTYKATTRNIDFSPAGDVAWFDELLDNASYGTCRGTGVLRRIGKEWRITQYHLTIPIPNDLADTVVKMIREMPKLKK
jgi:hypothetical protein